MNREAHPSPAPRWFIVDDESMLARLAEQILNRFTVADVRTCTDPHEAFVRMAAAPAGLELLMTDLNMPGMSGLELARRVRAVSPATKVVLMSGDLRSLPDEHSMKFHGIDFLLPKPFSVQQLLAVVRQLCGAASLKPSLNR